MKERLITLGGAILAFYGLFVLLFPQPEPATKPLSLATTEDRGKHGLAAAYHWLGNSQIRRLSLRDRYHALHDDPQLPRSGNILIVSLPLRVNTREWEEQQLLTWVEEGNTIVLLAAMSDWPEWALRQADNTNYFLSLFEYELAGGDVPEINEPAETTEGYKPKANKLPGSEQRHLQPAMPHPLTHGIQQIEATWKTTEGLDWQIEGDVGLRSLLVLLRDAKDNTAAFWQGRYGNGRIYFSRHADIFSNAALARQDNARLLANLVQHNLAADGLVIFDDMHQGLSKLYDPAAFFGDSRLHHTLLFLLALWLIYLLGHTNRFQPVSNKPVPMRMVDHMTAIGSFLSRRLQSYAVAQRIFFHFFNEIRHYHGLPRNGQPAWDKLEHYRQLDKQQIQLLINYHQQAENQQSVNLVKLGRLINSIRNKLS